MKIEYKFILYVYSKYVRVTNDEKKVDERRTRKTHIHSKIYGSRIRNKDDERS